MDRLNLDATMERVASAAARVGRSQEGITVVAVGKTFEPAVLKTAYEAGHRDFGENRAQELARKAPTLPDDVSWHFIGPLQRNKVRLVRPTGALLHSLDRVSLAESWLKGPGRPPAALVEVNIGEEQQKAGIHPDQAVDMVGTFVELGVEVRGIMAIPPRVESPEEARPFFAAMARLGADIQAFYPEVQHLSMGMSDDFEVAIEEGATIVRIGRAIFGARKS